MEAGGLSGKKIKWAGLFFLILFLFFTKSHKRREIPLEIFFNNVNSGYKSWPHML
jgi:hypothetical protein